MSRDAAPSGNLAGRLALIGLAALLMGAGILLADRAFNRRASAAPRALPVGIVVASGEPIGPEADVFRRPLANAELALTRRAAHPRTLSTFRALRAYPGAPPIIPHGLTLAELRTASCRTCHERGGYVSRFSAYAPITPHPEYTECLQCHLVDDALAGTPLPDDFTNASCRQCHAANGSTAARVALDWRPAAWPVLPTRTSDAPPPGIPHDLQLRGNCVACHAGAGAVAEIRSPHPERSNCRQCHLPAEPEVAPFTRPIPGGER